MTRKKVPLSCLDCGRIVTADHWCSAKCRKAWERRVREDPEIVIRIARVVPRVRRAGLE